MQTISYFPGGGKSPIHTKVAPWHVTAWAAIEPRRFLLGGIDGSLHVLMLEDGAPTAAASANAHTLGANVQLRVEYLGTTSIAHKLQYIDNGFVLVGSLYGDSQLIRLSADPIPIDEVDDAEGEAEKKTDAMDTSDTAAPVAASSSSASKVTRPNFIQVVNTFPNLGSILDLTMVDLERSGQCQVMTCSGAYQDSSLRVIRNGIGITEEASIELEGIQGVWGVRAHTNDEFHRYLVQTYASETRMLALEQDDESEELALAECEIGGFDASQRTVFAGNIGADLLLQVTQESCRLVDAQSLQLVDEWKPNGTITVATANPSQLLLAAGKLVVLLTLQGKKFKVEQQTTLDEEISCMDMTPVSNRTSTPLRRTHPFLAVPQLTLFSLCCFLCVARWFVVRVLRRHLYVARQHGASVQSRLVARDRS
jgi:DNA damage-binding protein 1